MTIRLSCRYDQNADDWRHWANRHQLLALRSWWTMDFTGKDNFVRIKILLTACSLVALGSSGQAQIAMKVDPNTGNYVPIRDPFTQGDANPDMPNPNRLSNRQSQRNAPTVSTQPGSPPAIPNDGLTAAQRIAKRGAYNGQAGGVQISRSGNGPDGFAPLGSMQMYTSPSAASQTDSQSNLPDWWPK